MPFSGTEAAQTQNISAGKYKWKPERWTKVSESGVAFVKDLLLVQPGKRPTAQAALDHPWIATRHKHGAEEVSPDIADALRSFGHASKFRRACLEMMAWSLSNEERAKVREYFVLMDKNHHGTITLAELKEVMVNKFHIPDEETREIFHALDSNHDDTVHYADFLAAMVSTRIALHDDLLKATFKKFDTDDSGYITIANLKEVLGDSFDGQQVEDMLKEADFTHDGKISYQEFVAYVKQTPMDHHQEATAKIVDSVVSRGMDQDKELEKKHRIVKVSQKQGEKSPLPETTPKAPVKESNGQGGCCVIF